MVDDTLCRVLPSLPPQYYQTSFFLIVIDFIINHYRAFQAQSMRRHPVNNTVILVLLVPGTAIIAILVFRLATNNGLACLVAMTSFSNMSGISLPVLPCLMDTHKCDRSGTCPVTLFTPAVYQWNKLYFIGFTHLVFGALFFLSIKYFSTSTKSMCNDNDWLLLLTSPLSEAYGYNWWESCMWDEK